MTTNGVSNGMHLSIRMRVCPDTSLNGYVFTDHEHARTWLSASWIKPESVKLERVQVGELRKCRTCGGNGHVQTIKKVCDVSLIDVLSKEPVSKVNIA